MKSYDFSIMPDYLSRQMFLDPAGPVTVQRFEEVAYPKIQAYEEMQAGFFWRPQEISLQQDKIDHKKATEAQKFVFTQNLLRQTALDSLQGRAPAQVFTPVCSVPELEAMMSAWSYFETAIHSKSYSHIIRNIYNMPKDEFNTIHDIQPIIDMAASVGRYYDELHQINARKDVGETVTEEEHIDAIWMALNASYALEALRFMVSFATSLAMVENRIYMGNGNIISLILQDEMLHTEWTAYLINQVVKDDPRFAAAKVRKADEVMAMYLEVIQEEKTWADHIFQHGVVVGLNAPIMYDFVDYRATFSLKEIGLKVPDEIRNNQNPIPWFNKHTRVSSKQTALQESESTSYIIGAMGGEIEHEELPDL
jgi:ribonucleoside-diphosphate reductase beta chain